MPPPPTIADLRRMGLAGVWITCDHAHCGRQTAVSWADLGLPDETFFPDIHKLKRYRCSACGGRAFRVDPDWRAYHPQGGG